jgi:hypothetical protein
MKFETFVKWEPLLYGHFAASNLVVTHQQAQFKKIKSKQQIKNQNTNRRRQTHPPPAPESMQPASIASRKTAMLENQLSGRKKSALPTTLFFPQTQHHRPEKNQKKKKKKTTKQKKSTKPKKKNKTQTPNHF